MMPMQDALLSLRSRPANDSSAVPPYERGRRYAGRRAARRWAACARARARVVVPLSRPPAPARQPSARQRGLRRLGAGGLAVLASLALHVGVVLGGLYANRFGTQRRPGEETVRIEMRESAPVPPPPPAAAKPAPKEPAGIRAERPAEPRLARKPPAAPKAEPMTAAPAARPARVVGLSLEATVEGAGGGPAFAVGETRLGDTAREAAGPRSTTAAPPAAAPPRPAAAGAAHANRIASSLPLAGITITQPRRKAAIRPPYPETLRSQGIEADVVVLVSIDVRGRVTNVKLLGSSPYSELDEAARRAALAEELEPARRNGEPIPYTLKYTYFFRLDDR